MKKMLLLILLTLTSCGLFKTTTRHKQRVKTHITERGTITYKAPGQQIVYLPNIKVKDTDIVIRKPRLNMALTKRQGQVKKVTCKTPPLDVKQEYEKETDQKQTQTDSKSKGVSFKPVYIAYVFMGIGFLILVNNMTKRS